MKKKILLASGCSFTFEPWCWPGSLSESLDYKLLNVGMASQGNGLISRKVIYNVENLLKEYNVDDILVGIMWSGIDRHDYYNLSNKNVNFWGGFSQDVSYIKNPTNIIDDQYYWRIINGSWNNKETKLYYENFHTDVFSMIMTIEHILRIQLYLEKLNIKYFMSTYIDIFDDLILINHSEVKYLYDLIDFTKFLPVSGCYEWVRDNYPIEGLLPLKSDGFVDNHPLPFGHKKFTEEVILPYLKNNNIINEY